MGIGSQVHEPLGKPGGPGLWGTGEQFPAGFQHLAQALIRSGKSKSDAIRIAWGSLRNWAEGKGDVKPETRARAIKILAELEAIRAKAHATPNTKGTTVSASNPVRDRILAQMGEGEYLNLSAPFGGKKANPFGKKPDDDTSSSGGGNDAGADAAATLKAGRVQARKKGLAQLRAAADGVHHQDMHPEVAEHLKRRGLAEKRGDRWHATGKGREVKLSNAVDEPQLRASDGTFAVEPQFALSGEVLPAFAEPTLDQRQRIVDRVRAQTAGDRR